MNLPSLQEESNPLTMINICNHQQSDADLMQVALESPTKYINKEINRTNVFCTIKSTNKPEEMNWKIWLPNSLIHEAIQWYHLVLGHPGETRLTYSMKVRFSFSSLTQCCKEYRCEDNFTAARYQN